jgi:hypothetical protein
VLPRFRNDLVMRANIRTQGHWSGVTTLTVRPSICGRLWGVKGGPEFIVDLSVQHGLTGHPP